MKNNLLTTNLETSSQAMPLISIPSNGRVGVVGFSGCGKSVLAQWLAFSWACTKAAVFISDPLDSPDRPSIWRGWGIACESAAEIGHAWNDGHRVIRLVNMDPDETEGLINMAWATPDSALILDESSLFLNSNMNHCPPAFKNIVCMGRRHGQGLILLGQTHTHMPAGFRVQAHMFISNQIEGTGAAWSKDRGSQGEQVAQFDWFVSSPSGEQARMPRLQPLDLVALAIGNQHLGKVVQDESGPESELEWGNLVDGGGRHAPMGGDNDVRLQPVHSLGPDGGRDNPE